MNEDQNLIPNVPNAAVPSEAEKLARAEIAQADDFAQATHQLPAISDELSGFIKPVVPPAHSLEGTGGIETPVKRASVSGEAVVLDYPGGFSSEDQIRKGMSANPKEWLFGASHVWRRQVDRKAA